MRKTWIKCVALGLGILAWQGRAVAQGPLTASGVLSTILDPDEKDKKEHPKGHDEGKHDEEHGHHEHHEPPDLGLRDFLTTGWSDKFEERERKDRAPRFNLFKTRQGFLERIITVNYGFESRADQGRFDAHEVAIGIEYALNRRFEIDVEPFYTWKRSRGDRASQNGLRWDTGMRFQLIDTADSALNYQLRIITPQTPLDERQTVVGSVLAGFNDLTKLGLCRTGLYYHFEYDALVGPRDEEPEAEGLPPGQRPSSRITYSVALAKTLVDPEVRFIGDFTVFVEAFGLTNLNGSRGAETFFSLTPGVRMNLSGREEKAWWLQTGVEIPVAGRQRGFEMGFRISLIHDF